MKSVFLSYSRKNIDGAKLIGRVLTVGGLRTWQDITSLSAGATEEQVRRAIREECFSLLFYISKESVRSEFIRNIELKEAYGKHTRDGEFTIVPLFGIPITDADTELKGSLPVDISTFNGAKAEEPGGLPWAAQRVRQTLLGNYLKLSPPGEKLLAVMSKQRTPGGLDVLLDLDWSKRYESELLLKQETWDSEIRPALLDVKDSLLRAAQTHLRILSKAHLSIGFAFGFVFRKVTGFQIDVQQDDQWWSTKADCSSGRPDLKVVDTPGSIHSKSLGIDISISQDTQPGLSEFIKRYDISFRSIIRFIPSKGSSRTAVRDGAIASSIAKEVGENIRLAHAKYGTTEIHIFAAIPLGLAYLIGSELNACGSIHLHEFDNSTRQYFPSWTIEGRE